MSRLDSPSSGPVYGVSVAERHGHLSVRHRGLPRSSVRSQRVASPLATGLVPRTGRWALRKPTNDRC